MKKSIHFSMAGRTVIASSFSLLAVLIVSHSFFGGQINLLASGISIVVQSVILLAIMNQTVTQKIADLLEQTAKEAGRTRQDIKKGKRDATDEIRANVRELAKKLREQAGEVSRYEKVQNEVIEKMPIAFGCFREDGHVKYATPLLTSALLGETQNVYDAIKSKGKAQKEELARAINVSERTGEFASFFSKERGVKEEPGWVKWSVKTVQHNEGAEKEIYITGEKIGQKPEDNVEQIVNSIIDLVYLVGDEGKVSYANKENEDVLGISAKEIVGKSIYNIVHEDDKAFLREEIEKRFKKEKTGIETRALKLKKSNNSYETVQAAFDSVVTESERVSDVAINAKNVEHLMKKESEITEALSAAKEMLETVKTLEFIIDKSPVITIVWDESGKVTYASKNIGALGYPNEAKASGVETIDTLLEGYRDLIVSENRACSYQEYPPIPAKFNTADGRKEHGVAETTRTKKQGKNIYYTSIKMARETSNIN